MFEGYYQKWLQDAPEHVREYLSSFNVQVVGDLSVIKMLVQDHMDQCAVKCPDFYYWWSVRDYITDCITHTPFV